MVYYCFYYWLYYTPVKIKSKLYNTPLKKINFPGKKIEPQFIGGVEVKTKDNEFAFQR